MIILASQSTIRRSYLEKLGVAFTVQPAHVDESELKNETPLAYVKRIAMAKAAAISAANPGSIVIAADTPLIIGRRILQTPQTADEARTMLQLYSGRRVQIPTIVVVADTTGKLHTKLNANWLKFKRLSSAEIESYLAANLWEKTCGGIKIEHMQPWLQTIHGSISGIIGLPLYETSVLLARAGVQIEPFKVGAGG